MTSTSSRNPVVAMTESAGSRRDSLLSEQRITATWEEIARTLRTAENGKAGAADVELRPGGELVLTGREQAAQPLSRLPKGRMA